VLEPLINNPIHVSMPSTAQGAADSKSIVTIFVYALASLVFASIRFLTIQETQRILMEIIVVAMTFTAVSSAIPAAVKLSRVNIDLVHSELHRSGIVAIPKAMRTY
jgi:hypothetical protein